MSQQTPFHQNKTKDSLVHLFYKPTISAKEVRAGYLYKSPPQKRLKPEKLWKKRFFVLFKISEHEYHLRYFRSHKERESSIGGIDLTQISLLYASPQHHQRWSWVQKSLKCSPSCVLYIRAAERDYFLVGESRSGHLYFYAFCIIRLQKLMSVTIHGTSPITAFFILFKHRLIDFLVTNLKVRDNSVIPGERQFRVKLIDLKNHLTLTEVDGKPSVSNWTGQPQSVCLFHKGDEIVAINDLHTGSVDEFNTFLNKSIKKEVKMTIVRLRGCQPLHLPNCPCSD
uniref:Pleckstrin homology domain containing S1, tandem duplicate 3 n=1 Tax=Nothobranchius furzeri TaxID=105023 RepID=A0A8C6NS93_NOTFU